MLERKWFWPSLFNRDKTGSKMDCNCSDVDSLHHNCNWLRLKKITM